MNIVLFVPAPARSTTDKFVPSILASLPAGQARIEAASVLCGRLLKGMWKVHRVDEATDNNWRVEIEIYV